jgi:transcriptional regulator with XRE-family HTH domain
MGKFVDQIRDAIRNCGTTKYSLSQQVGVSESALSRFMAGKSGLNLSTLDKLAEVLGLEVTVTVQRTRKPSPKGRKKGKTMKTLLDRTELQRLAGNLAEDAHENHFSSRRGLWYLDDVEAVCLYNNNPYAFDDTLRDRETKVLRKKLAAAGYKQLAYQTYPLPGEEGEGYTYALILQAGEDDMAAISDLFQQTYDEVTAPLMGNSPAPK